MSLITSNNNNNNKRNISEIETSENKNNNANNNNNNNKRKKLNLKEPGIEYKSKKSGGDVWKKGMLEPHAFIPLDARLLSKKHYKEAIDHFGVVVKNGKKSNKQKEKEIMIKNRNKKRK